jgi:hypothetical protein
LLAACHQLHMRHLPHSTGSQSHALISCLSRAPKSFIMCTSSSIKQSSSPSIVHLFPLHNTSSFGPTSPIHQHCSIHSHNHQAFPQQLNMTTTESKQQSNDIVSHSQSTPTDLLQEVQKLKQELRKAKEALGAGQKKQNAVCLSEKALCRMP